MAELQILAVADVKQQLSRLNEWLSKADFDRLEALLPLFKPRQASKAILANCLNTVAPGRTVQEQLADFRAFRQRLRQAARQAGLGLALEVDSKKRSDPQGRVCWFTQPTANRIADAVAAFSQGATASLDPATTINSRAMVSVAPTRVQFFVSYDTDRDRPLAQNLLTRLQLEFKASRHYEYATWDESAVLVGEHRAHAIAEALLKADFGLLLLSTAWLGRVEPDGDLGVFVTDGAKPVLLVELRHVDVQRHNLHGLEAHKLFRLDASGHPRCFAECRSDSDKDRFAQQLAQQIEQRLQRWLALPNDVQSTPQPERVSPSPDWRDVLHDPDARAEELMRAWKQEGKSSAHVIRALAQETSLRDTLDVGPGDPDAARSVVALDVLQDWALDPHGAPYCAILGEYGIGKTTTLKQFTATLLSRRRDGESVPLPIFIDLRLYSPTIHKGEVPNLETLLQEILARVWETNHPQAFTVQDILRLVREEGAILIFDGLDEKLVHLDETQGRAFLRTLWNALPPFEARPARASERAGRQRAALAGTESVRPQGRLIFSCRSHYFKTLRDQNAILRGEDRDDVRASDYRAWVLLPFNEEQIREYLQSVLGPEGVEPAMDLFASVHNLRELAERPYLLSLIATHIGELEARQVRGDVVRGVTLYGLLVDAWLKRDGGKHHLRPEDKLTLMEDIAADMWQDGAREWAWPRVLSWLDARLARDEILRTRHASVAPTLLEEDFRTATFVLRPDSSQESFRFAHTSLQEYFLARYLLRALIDHAPEKWEMPFPSPETLDFLGQLLATAPARQRDAALRVIEELLGSYRPRATDMALRYWLLAVQHDLPAPAPGRVDLHGADLSGLTVRGRSPSQPLNLVDANLSEAQLVETRFEHVDLTGANLTCARAERAEFHHVLAREITVTEADMTAAVWRYCDALGLQGGASAHWYDCQWIACDLDPDTLPADFGLQGTLSYLSALGRPVPNVHDREVTTVFGHGGSVWACGFAPDGATIVSGAGDRTVKVWDARSGKCLRTLEGHRGSVWACGFAPDGATIVSGAGDRTVKVWDARSGKCLRTLEGHGDSVRACGFAPDGATIVSGADDRTVKVWDARSGKCLRTLEGHGGSVQACGFAPDGATIVSGADDRTVKVWDARSGKCLRTLEGHGGSVQACGFAPDGATIVSGAGDRTVKVWDARSGKCLRTLEGHGGSVQACGFAPDGATIVSGAGDRTVKVWDARSGKCLRTLEGHGGSVQACGFAPDGATIVSGAGDRTVKVWDARSGKCLRTLEGHGGSVRACGFAPDGATIVSGADDRTVKVWDARSGKCLRTLEGHGGSVWACGFAPDGATIVSGAGDRTVKVWDARSGKCLHTLEGHGGSVQACGFAPDGATIVSGAGDRTVKVWDARSGKCLRTLEGHGGSVQACGFAPDGATIVSGAGDRTVKVWDARSGKCLRTLEGHGGSVQACGFAPDGATIVSGADDRTVKVWDARSGKCLRTLEGHGGSVWACGFAPDGATIVSGAGDRTVKVWDARSGKCLRTLEGHGGSVRACGFAPDGATIVSGADDGTVKVWEVSTEDMCLTLINAPHGQTAALDERHNRILAVSPDAWRYLGWRTFDTHANRLRILPAEHFGPLPVG